jgi:hypothetical protein
MTYPYTNKEIQEISDTIANLIFGWITKMDYVETC